MEAFQVAVRKGRQGALAGRPRLRDEIAVVCCSGVNNLAFLILCLQEVESDCSAADA